MSDEPKNEPKRLPKPVDWEELYPGRFLKGIDLKGNRYTLTVVDVNLEELEGDKGPQTKGVITFKETEKLWAMNRTNGVCVKAMFGRKVQEWKGKRVTLFPGVHNGEPCIRVYGSPDIAEAFEVTIKLPRKKPTTMVMHKTDLKQGAA